jgi:hypothetical protein
MRILIKTAILLVGMAALFHGNIPRGAHERQSQSDSKVAKTIVVMVNKTQGAVTYEVESKAVRDPLRTLGELVEQRGEDCPVIVILPWNATFREELDVEVIASKAGFKNIRSFLYNPERGFMREINWGRSIPFSTNPPVN